MSDGWGHLGTDPHGPDLPTRPAVVIPAVTSPAPVRAAREANQSAAGAVTIARARLRDAQAAAPTTDPIVAAAVDALGAAERAAGDSDVDLATAQRQCDDRDGALRSFLAKERDAQTNAKSTEGQRVTAEERVAAGERACTAAREHYDRAVTTQAAAHTAVLGAREQVTAARTATAGETVAVLTAREQLRAAELKHADARAAQAEAEAAASKDGDTAKNQFPTVYAFVEQYIAEIYAEDLTESAHEVAWCPQWFRHPDALARLEAAWQAFETLRQEAGTGRSVWFRDHGDPCMSRLLGKDGPFKRCDKGRHMCKPALVLATPAAWLTDHDGSTVHQNQSA